MNAGSTDATSYVAGTGGVAAIPTLTVCIVAHNEEGCIATALESVAGWAGEIIVVDCESSDATPEIAAAHGALVVPHPNLLPEITKNAAFDRAHGTWILSLDADEVLPAALREEIRSTLEREPIERGFKIPRRNFYFGTPLMHGGNFPDYQLRLFRKGYGRLPGKGIHERVVIDGTVGTLENVFDHHPYPTFEMWTRKFEFYTRMEAARLRSAGAPLRGSSLRSRMIYRPVRRWIERLFLKRGIRDGVAGILAATFDFMTIVVGYGRYWMGEGTAESDE